MVVVGRAGSLKDSFGFLRVLRKLANECSLLLSTLRYEHEVQHLLRTRSVAKSSLLAARASAP